MTRSDLPLIVIAGAATWRQQAQVQLHGAWQVESWTDRSHYVTRLADRYAALVLVDTAAPDWRFWTATPKSSPATRRIPLIVTAAAPHLRAVALQTGADIVLTPDALLQQLPVLVKDYARVFDATRAEVLACACRDPLPILAQQGVAQFNAGAYYKQHDLFEALWVETEGPVRDLYRAILQVGVAYYQIERGNYRGALKMLLRSVQWLCVLPDQCQGVDVAALRRDSYAVRAELERLGPQGIAAFDRSLLQPLRLLT